MSLFGAIPTTARIKKKINSFKIMAKTEKNNFVFFHQWREYFEGLSDREVGMIVNAILLIRTTGVDIEEIDFHKNRVAKQMVRVLLSNIRAAENSYNELSETRRQNRISKNEKQNSQEKVLSEFDDKNNKNEQKNFCSVLLNKNNKTQQNITNDVEDDKKNFCYVLSNKNNKTQQNDYRIDKNRIDNNNIIVVGDDAHACTHACTHARTHEGEKENSAQIINAEQKEEKEKNSAQKEKEASTFQADDKTALDYKNSEERLNILLGEIGNSTAWHDWIYQRRIPIEKSNDWFAEFHKNISFTGEYSQIYNDCDYKIKLKKHLQNYFNKKIQIEEEKQENQKPISSTQRIADRLKQQGIVL